MLVENEEKELTTTDEQTEADEVVAPEQASNETVSAEAANSAEAAANDAGVDDDVDEEDEDHIDIERCPEGKWYIVNTYSGYEKQAKLGLEERIRSKKMEERFGPILIPSENVVEVVKGKKRTTNKRFFPGYILVKMMLDDNTWHVVKSAPKVTGFVGGKMRPPAVPEQEVLKLTRQIADGTLKPKHSASFETGESVRVVEGPFVNFNGIVDEVKPEKGKLRVLVSIFGRSTPVELDFVQVEKN